MGFGGSQDSFLSSPWAVPARRRQRTPRSAPAVWSSSGPAPASGQARWPTAWPSTPRALVAAGWGPSPNPGVLVERFTPTGALDSTFGSGGQTLTKFGTLVDSSGLGLAADNNGNIVVAGSGSNFREAWDRKSARNALPRPGQLDPTFSRSFHGALRRSPSMKGQNATGRGVVLESVGSTQKIVIDGNTSLATGRQGVLARLNPTAALTLRSAAAASSPTPSGVPTSSLSWRRATARS